MGMGIGPWDDTMGWPTGIAAWKEGAMGDGFGGGRKAGPKGGTPASACRMGPVCKTGTGAALDASRCTATSCATCNFSCRTQYLSAKCSAEPCRMQLSLASGADCWDQPKKDAFCQLWQHLHSHHLISTLNLYAISRKLPVYACCRSGAAPDIIYSRRKSSDCSLTWACQMLRCVKHS